MSEPKRYDNFQYETKYGEYILYTDYAILKAEAELLRKAVETSPITLINLAKLEGKTTYEEINGKPLVERSPSFIEDLGNGVEKHDLLFRVKPSSNETKNNS